MSTKATLLAAVVGIFACTSSSPAIAAWKMFKGGGDRTGYTSLKGPRYVDLEWQQSLGAGTVVNYGSPTIDANGRIYIGTADGILRTFDSDGAPGWIYDTAATQSTFFGDQNTPSAAIATDGSVYVLDPQGTLHKLDSTGGFIWKYDHPAANSGDSHPLIASNGDIVIAVYQYIPPVTANGFMISLKPDMSVNWTKSHPGVGHVLSGPVEDAQGNIYVCAFNNLYKYTQAGALVAPYPYVNPVHYYNTPAIDPSGNILLNDAQGYMLSVDPVTATLNWQYKFGTFSQSSVSVSPDSYATGTAWAGFAAGVNALNGDLKWLFSTSNSRARSSNLLDGDKVTYFGVDNGTMYAIDQTGNIVWSYKQLGATRARSTPAPAANGNLIVAFDTSAGAKLVSLKAQVDPLKTVRGAKGLPEGSNVSLPNKIVTLVEQGSFYIQDYGAVAGIKVISDAIVSRGDIVSVTGQLASDVERILNASSVQVTATGVSPQAVKMGARAVGGATTGANQGITYPYGPNNIGSLVTISGKVSDRLTLGPDAYSFLVDDGSRPFADSDNTGVKVYAEIEPFGNYVTITGVVSLEYNNGYYLPVIKTRDANDVVEEDIAIAM